MEEALIKAMAAVGGVGGLLAALMFWFYRKDSEAHAARQEEYLVAATKANSLLVSVVRDNTEAMTQLVASTGSLQKVVASLDNNAIQRDLWFREHLAPVFSRLSPP